MQSVDPHSTLTSLARAFKAAGPEGAPADGESHDDADDGDEGDEGGEATFAEDGVVGLGEEGEFDMIPPHEDEEEEEAQGEEGEAGLGEDAGLAEEAEGEEEGDADVNPLDGEPGNDELDGEDDLEGGEPAGASPPRQKHQQQQSRQSQQSQQQPQQRGPAAPPPVPQAEAEPRYFDALLAASSSALAPAAGGSGLGAAAGAGQGAGGGRDMTEVYRQAGGLGTPAGRALFALYNREQARSQKHSFASVYITRAQQAPVRKAAPDPDAEHKARIRERNDAIRASKAAYKAPRPPAPASVAPAMSRNARMLAALPRRRSQAAIEAQRDRDAAASAPMGVAGGAVRRGAGPSREAAVARLQQLMEDAGKKAAAAGGPQDGSAPPAVASSAMRKGSLRAALAGPSAAPSAGPVREEERLFQEVVGEVREREEFLRRMQALRGGRKRTAAEAASEQRVSEEIRERRDELLRLDALLDS